jgi:hypothetical protein
VSVAASTPLDLRWERNQSLKFSCRIVVQRGRLFFTSDVQSLGLLIVIHTPPFRIRPIDPAKVSTLAQLNDYGNVTVESWGGL